MVPYQTLSISQIQTRLVELEALRAIAIKAKSTTFSDQTLVLRQMDEYDAEEARLRRMLAQALGSGGTRYAATSKGV